MSVCVFVCVCVSVTACHCIELEAKLENNNDERRIILERFVSKLYATVVFTLTDSI